MSETRKKDNVLIAMIKSPFGGIHSSQNVLARVWRILLHSKERMSGERMDCQLTKWQQRLNVQGTKIDISSKKGNITKTLAQTSITWNAFLCGLSILEYVKMDIKITFYKKDGESNMIELTEIVIDNDNDIDPNEVMEKTD